MLSKRAGMQIWRHGDRAPLAPATKDPREVEFWKGQWGQLTSEGIAEIAQLGKQLRQMYVLEQRLLTSTSQAAIRSTNTSRTIVSAYTLLDSLFNIQNSTKLFNIEILPQNTDPLYPNASCAAVNSAMRSLESTKSYQATMKIAASIAPIVGNMTTPMDIILTESAFKISSSKGFDMPSDYTPEVAHQLHTISASAYAWFVGAGDPPQPIVLKLRAGPFITDIISHMQAFINGSNINTKFFGYSAHDLNIAATLAALGSWKQVIPDTFPDYASSVSFELWSINEEPAVKILFSEGFGKAYSPITRYTTSCPDSDFCALQTFVNRSEALSVRDFQKDCQN